MNKTDLITAIAEKAGLPRKDAEKALGALLETVADTLTRGEKIQLVGFGTFETKDRQARAGRNPSTGETIQIPAARLPVFKPGKALRDAVSQ